MTSFGQKIGLPPILCCWLPKNVLCSHWNIYVDSIRFRHLSNALYFMTRAAVQVDPFHTQIKGFFGEYAADERKFQRSVQGKIGCSLEIKFAARMTHVAT